MRSVALVLGGILLANLLPLPFKCRRRKKLDKDDVSGRRSPKSASIYTPRTNGTTSNVPPPPGNERESATPVPTEKATSRWFVPSSNEWDGKPEERVKVLDRASGKQKRVASLGDALYPPSQETVKNAEGVIRTRQTNALEKNLGKANSSGVSAISAGRDKQTGETFGWVVFWDYENVVPPLYVSGFFIMSRLRELLKEHRGGSGVDPLAEVIVYANVEQMTKRGRQFMELQAAGAAVHHIETHNRKDALDKALLVDFCLASRVRKPPFGFCLISGDQDYVTAVSKIRNFGYSTVVISNEKCSRVLKKAVEGHYVFSSDVLGLVPHKQKRKRKNKISVVQTLGAERYGICISSNEAAAEVAVLNPKRKRKSRQKRRREVQAAESSATSNRILKVQKPDAQAMNSNAGSRVMQGRGPSGLHEDHKESWKIFCFQVFPQDYGRLTKKVQTMMSASITTFGCLARILHEESLSTVALVLSSICIIIGANTFASLKSSSRRLGYVLFTVLVFAIMGRFDSTRRMAVVKEFYNLSEMMQNCANTRPIIVIAQVFLFSSIAVFVVSKLRRSQYLTASLLSSGDSVESVAVLRR